MLKPHRLLAPSCLLALTLLIGCQPGPPTAPPGTAPPVGTSASPQIPTGVPSGAPSEAPSGAPSAAPTPTPALTPNPAGGATATVQLPDGTRLELFLPNRFLTDLGQSVAMVARLFDASGREIPLGELKLRFSSSRPQDFSVSEQGVITALTDEGFSTITVQIDGTQLSASQLISVAAGFSGGGAGGGRPGPTATATPFEDVNADVGFEGLELGEFQVNTFGANGQVTPAVAMDSDGDFVVTWENYSQDGDREGIFAQRYSSTGIPLGSEFQVNSSTINPQRFPGVAMDSAGNFVLVWASFDQDGSNYGIFGQRYNRTGTAQGPEFQVNAYTSNRQTLPDVAMDSDGDFVVTWTSYGSQDGFGRGIFGRRYDSAGVAQTTTEFQINSYTTDSQFSSAVAMDSAGDFVVTWHSGPGQDGDGYGIFGQRYTSAGLALGTEFQVNSFTTEDQAFPAIAMDSAGDFVVTWNNLDSIVAQRYDSAGQAQ